MSCNRENVTWQSPDGTWNIGFFEFYDVAPEDDEEWDYEWDVEYDHSRFWFLSQGNRTPEAAMLAYSRQNANPGGTMEVCWEGNQEECRRYDEMAEDAKRRKAVIA